MAKTFYLCKHTIFNLSNQLWNMPRSSIILGLPLNTYMHIFVYTYFLTHISLDGVQTYICGKVGIKLFDKRNFGSFVYFKAKFTNTHRISYLKNIMQLCQFRCQLPRYQVPRFSFFFWYSTILNNLSNLTILKQVSLTN